jgi:hypothetical protein
MEWKLHNSALDSEQGIINMALGEQISENGRKKDEKYTTIHSSSLLQPSVFLYSLLLTLFSHCKARRASHKRFAVPLGLDDDDVFILKCVSGL